jgi:glycerol-3-phosphate dehydrogenase
MRPAKGIHLVLPREKVPVQAGVVIPSVARDRRSMFAVPWGPTTVIGTTDTEYSGPIESPSVDTSDVAYMLSAVNWSLGLDVGADDVVSAWAGLRPLLAGKGGPDTATADLSRKHYLSVSNAGLVTITGGKLTTYRRMAADTVDEVDALLGKRRRCRTKRLKLIGADGYEDPPETNEPSRHEHLAHRYGTEGADVEALVDRESALGEPLVPGLPYLKAEAVHAVRSEMARTLDDVLTRRTRARLLARDDSAAAAEDTAALVGRELGWDDAERARQVKEYRAAVAAERDAADLPETQLGT